MGDLTGRCREGVQVGPLVKQITQEAIDLFEGSAGQTGPSQFTDDETARRTLGTQGTVASGRMTLTFAIEMMRRHFGPEVFNHAGAVDLRFLRPVRPGHTLTLQGVVSGVCREANGSRVSVDVQVTNQDGNVVSAGTGSVVVPNAYLPQET